MLHSCRIWSGAPLFLAALLVVAPASRGQQLTPLINDVLDDELRSVLMVPPADAIQHDPYVAALPSSRAGQATPEIIRQRYPSRAVKTVREVIQDREGNYINHGPWTYYDEQGEVIAEGQFRFHKYHGTWSRTYKTGDAKLFSSAPYNQFEAPFLSQATFQDGNLDGTWTILDAKQRKISQWTFVDGQRNGSSTWWYPDGRILQQVEYRHGLIDGSVKQWDASSKLVIDDNYQKGRKLAAKIVYHSGSQQKKSEGMYLFARIIVKTTDDWWAAKPAVFTTEGKDERHGTWTTWHANGQIQQQGEFANDLPVGKMKWWYSNGQESLAGSYLEGKQQGKWAWWHTNGQKSTDGEYTEGTPSGAWMWWHDNGRVAQRANFSDGQRSVTVPAAPRDAALPQNGPSGAGAQFKY